MLPRLIGVVIPLLAFVWILPAPQSGGADLSDRTSPCGAVGLPAHKLGLERTRALTLCLLNEERSRHGLAALAWEPRLELAAQRYSVELTKRQFFEHVNPEGVDPQARILAAGYPSNNALTGENLAWGTGSESSPVEIVDGWMHSPGHRANILRAGFTQVGVGVVFDAPEKPRSLNPAATYTTNFGGPATLE